MDESVAPKVLYSPLAFDNGDSARTCAKCTEYFQQDPQNTEDLCCKDGELKEAKMCLRPCKPEEAIKNPTTPKKQSSQVFFSTESHQNKNLFLPTPEQTPPIASKRHFPDVDIFPSDRPIKRLDLGLNPASKKSPFRRNSIPKYSILSRSPTKVVKYSADELKRVSEAVLRQVDWEEVGEYVASNRGARVYRKIIKKVLQDRIDELFEEECTPEDLAEEDY